jgi:Tfp pilus assembly protein PilX
MRRRLSRKHQSGVVLIISLILLVLLTLFAVTAINFTNIQSRIAGNTQAAGEIQAAVQQALEQKLSTDFSTAPAGNTADITIAATNYRVTVATPVCVSALPVALTSLDPVNVPSDRNCTKTANADDAGNSAGNSSSSLCIVRVWDLKASFTDDGSAAGIINTLNTGTTATLHQGIGGREMVGGTC